MLFDGLYGFRVKNAHRKKKEKRMLIGNIISGEQKGGVVKKEGGVAKKWKTVAKK
jgi:hypothetical protein